MIVQSNEKEKEDTKRTRKTKKKIQNFMSARRLVRSLNVARHCMCKTNK